MQGQGDQAKEDTVLGPYIEPVQLQVVCRRLWENLPDRPIGNRSWETLLARIASMRSQREFFNLAS